MDGMAALTATLVTNQRTRSLEGVLSPENLGVLARLDLQLSCGLAARERHPAATLFDLEGIADLIESDQPAMVFQPIVALATGEVRGYEALARFQGCPSRSPDFWFAQATRVGLGTELEIKAMRAALGSLEEVPQGRFMSVNVSAATLCAPSLAAVLDGVPGERVVIEVTEHELVDDYALVNATTARLRAAGFRLAVDDAGTGCAGKTHIVNINPDVIKLDRTIVQAIDLHCGRRDLAASLIALAREIGATVVAEGIESGDEAAVLTAMGVDEGQGYLYGRPTAAPWRSAASSGCPDGRLVGASVG